MTHRECAIVLGLYAAMAIFFTWPTAAHLGEVGLLSVSSPFDALIYRWNFDWLNRYWSDPGVASPFVTSQLFFPDSVSLALYTPTYLHSVFSLPIQWLLPGQTGLNVAFHSSVLGSFTLASFATYALGRRENLTDAGAFIAGVAFAYCAGRYTNIARLNVLCSELIPVALLGATWLIEERRMRGPLVFAAACIGLAYSSVAHVVTTAIALAVVVPFCWRRRAEGWLSRGLGATLVCLIAAVPLVPGFIAALAWPAFDAVNDQSRIFLSLEPLSLLWPNVNDIGLGWLPHRPQEFLERHFSFFIGMPVLVLVVLAGLLRRVPLALRHGAAWATLAGVGAVLAIGPELKWLGQPSGFSLPYAWLQPILPPLSMTRVPARFVVLLSLGLALVAGLGLDRLRQHRQWRSGPSLVIVAILSLWIALDGAERWPLATLEVQPDQGELAGLLGSVDSDHAVLDLPFDVPHTRRMAMYYQTAHHRPILFADYVRAPRTNTDHFATSRLFALLTDPSIDAKELARELERLDLHSEREQLRELGVGALVFHHRFFLRVIGQGNPGVARGLDRGRVLEAVLGRAWGAPRRVTVGFYDAAVFMM